MSASTVDALTLERMGVPAVPMGSELLVNTTGKGTARLQGAPNLPFIALRDMPGNPKPTTPEELRVRVLMAVEEAPRIASILTGGES